jgi:hypothetical protein
MSELSPEARGLVDDGHSVLRPSQGDRARVKSALAARLGGAAFLLPYQASASAPKALLGWSKLSATVASVGAGLVVMGGAAYYAAQPSVEPAPVAPVKPPALAPTKPRPAVTPTESTTDVELEAPAREPAVSPSRKSPTPDPLVEEVAILSKATSALRAGKPAEGLRLLSDHQRKFPNGRLAEERRAARIQALCALGRRTEAEAELTRLAQSSPRSPHLARAQRACGLTP